MFDIASLRARFGPFVCSLAVVSATTFASSALAQEYIVTDRATNRVIALDATTGAFSRLISTSPLLDEPNSVVLGPGGDLLVASLQSNRILRIDPSTGSSSVYLTLDASVAPGTLLYEPNSGDLFVSQFLDVTGGGQTPGSSVFRYNSAGSLVQTFTTEAGPTGRTGMTLDAAGDLYVSAFTADQSGNGIVLKYDASNGYSPLGVFASGAAVPGGAVGFNGLAFDTAGDLFTAALFSQSLVKFDVDAGAVIGQTIHNAPIAYPSGVLAMPDDSLIVTSLGNNNPGDPIYGGFLFPGTILRVDAATGAAQPLLVGDFDHSNTVGGKDFLQWQRSGAVMSDLSDWQAAFGNVSVAGDFQPTSVLYYEPEVVVGGALVPEPAAWLLAAGAAALGLCRRRNVA